MSETKKEKVVAVVREGSKIIIPEKMSYGDARKWLTRQEEAEESIVNIHHQFECYPLDGVVALQRAIGEIYGFSNLDGQSTWWGGVKPPTMVQVPLADGSYATAPLSRISIPTWEGGYIEPNVSMSRSMILGGEIKKKFEDQVKAIIAAVKNELAERSIYKGQAMKVDLSWMDGSRHFHPVNDAPKFIMGLQGVNENSIILNKETRFEVATNIFTLIEQSEACKRNKIPLRHGVLMAGTYGTGKTLLSRVIASKCPPNGWTFIYLENAEHIAECLHMAEMYAPAVVFAEDIDQVMSGERDVDMNDILNTIDGMDTKGKPIITILTTNSPEKIEPAFMRAGRMDTVITLGQPDAESAQEFVLLYAKDTDGHSLLAPDVDMTNVGKALANTSPAFIAESIHKAKRHAIYRTGDSNITGKLSTDDLVLAGKAMKKHIQMAEQRVVKTEPELLVEAASRVGKALNNGHNGHRTVTCPECDSTVNV
jgi:hypothetical protein